MCVFKWKQKDKNYLGYLKQFLKNFIFINLCDYFVFYKKNLKFSTQPFFFKSKISEPPSGSLFPQLAFGDLADVEAGLRPPDRQVGVNRRTHRPLHLLLRIPERKNDIR